MELRHTGTRISPLPRLPDDSPTSGNSTEARAGRALRTMGWVLSSGTLAKIEVQVRWILDFNLVSA